jgi:hypothetical protein
MGDRGTGTFYNRTVIHVRFAPNERQQLSNLTEY